MPLLQHREDTQTLGVMCMAGVREGRKSSEGAQRAAKVTALTALTRGANCELSGVSA